MSDIDDTDGDTQNEGTDTDTDNVGSSPDSFIPHSEPSIASDSGANRTDRATGLLDYFGLEDDGQLSRENDLFTPTGKSEKEGSPIKGREVDLLTIYDPIVGPLEYGGHSAIVLRDYNTNSNDKHLLYDPGGDFHMHHGGGSGAIVDISEVTLFSDFHKKRGSNRVEITTINVTKAQQDAMFRKIEEVKDMGPGRCAIAVEQVLREACDFSGAGRTSWFPDSLKQKAMTYCK